MVNMQQVAAAVGVSRQVVSKVLHGGRSSVAASEQTRRRVMETARRMGYRPNVAARVLRNRTFRSIGILMAGEEDHFYLPPRMLLGISRTLAPHRYSSVLVCAGKLDENNIADQQLLSDQCVDAILVGYAEDPPPALVSAVSRLDVPALWLFRDFPANCVTYDETGAAEMLVEHLAGLGHQRIDYFDLNAIGRSGPATRDRLSGFYAAAARRGVNAVEHIDQRIERPSRLAFFRRILSQPDRPRAIIADSSTAALALVGTALQMGLRLPEDLAVASYDTGSVSDAISPTITCAIAPELELGEAAAKMALELIARRDTVGTPPRSLAYRLRVGQTTAGLNHETHSAAPARAEAQNPVPLGGSHA